MTDKYPPEYASALERANRQVKPLRTRRCRTHQRIMLEENGIQCHA